MSWYDNYQKRLRRYGYNVGNVYKNSTENFVNNVFDSSPTYRRAGVISRKYPDMSQIDIRVIGVQRLGTLREVLFRPNESIEMGSYLLFDDEKWIVFDEYGTGISPKVMVAKCNRHIRWEDKTGKLHEHMCVVSATDLGSKAKQGKSEIEWNKYDIKLPRNQLFVFVPLNESTDNIKHNMRFIFGKRVYEVVGIDAITSVTMENFGIIQLTVKLDTTRENDNFDSGIAENLYGNEQHIDDDRGGRIW